MRFANSREPPIMENPRPECAGLRVGSKVSTRFADVAQLVERELPKLEVAGSRPVVRF